MANFIVSPEISRLSAPGSAEPKRAMPDPTAGRHHTGWRKFAAAVRRWTPRLALMPVWSLPRRRQEEGSAESEERLAPLEIYDALSEDGPFRRMSAKEARRHLIFACGYYLLLGLGILAMIIWH